MQSRRDEIKAKRARLVELQQQREQREREFAGSRQSLNPSTSRTTSPTAGPESQQDLDNLISSLVGAPTRPEIVSMPQPPARYPSRIDYNPAETDQHGEPSPSVATAAPTVRLTADRARQTLSFTPMQTVYEIKTEKPRPRPELESFSKGVQTMTWSSSSRSSSFSGSDSEPGSRNERLPMKKLSRRQREHDEQLRQRIRKEVEEEMKLKKDIEAAETQPAAEHDDAPKPKSQPLTSEDIASVKTSYDFLDFLDRSSKVVEKALHDDYDILADYKLDKVEAENDDTGDKGKKGKRLKEVMQFYDEKWSKKRMVTDLQFSEKFPELLLAAYTKNSSDPYAPDGVLQLWNLHLPTRSEHVFTAASDILTAKFHPFHPNLILGGAYSGQVLLWDTRSPTPNPVQSTSLTGGGHSHPIYSLNISGTQNAHSIVTASTDGTLCTWATDMMSTPQNRLLLRAPQAMLTVPATSGSTILRQSRSPFAKDLAVTCTAFPPNQAGYFLAGTEQGPIHLCHRHDRAGTPAGVDQQVYYRAHAAPIMSLDFHNAAGPHNLGDLLLSTGLDWNIRLWRIKPPAGAFVSASRDHVNAIDPLLEIQRDDAVYDAKWSPARPAVFATVDGAGWLDIWDLNTDLEAPVVRERPAPRKAAAGLNGTRGYGGDGDFGFIAGMDGQGAGRSLNKCAWQAGDGSKIAVGGLDGGVTVFEVGKDLCGVEAARAEEWDGVKMLISRLEGVGL